MYCMMMQWSVVRLRGLHVTDWTQAARHLAYVSTQVLVSMSRILFSNQFLHSFLIICVALFFFFFSNNAHILRVMYESTHTVSADFFLSIYCALQKPLFLRVTVATAVAHLTHRNSVCLSICHTSGSVKNDAR